MDLLASVESLFLEEKLVAINHIPHSIYLYTKSRFLLFIRLVRESRFPPKGKDIIPNALVLT